MKKLLSVSLAAVATTFVFAAYAESPSKPAIRENLVQKTATVEAIDHASRVVKLRTEDGNTSTIVVDEEVRNLPQVKVGDKIVVSYYEALAAEVKKPGEGVKGVEADVSSVRSEPGAKPGGGAGVLLRTTVTIESVDTTFNTVSFKRSDGQSRTVAVQSPEGREFIKGLKKGDEVEVAYTEALAIEVKPAN